MADSATPDSTLVHRANLNIAAAVVATYGSGASDSLIGRAIDEVRASHSVAELAGSGGMSMVTGAVETFLARQLEADRPRNLYSAEAARAAQAGEGGPRGFGTIEPVRAGSGARYRELGSGDGAKGDSSGSSGMTISGTGGEPAGAVFWSTAKGQMMTRAYASANGMDWAPPDLMKMGRPALEALKDSGLKGDGYKALRDPNGLNLSNATIVHGSQHYMKRFHLNHNEAAKAADRLYHNPALNNGLQGEVKGATEQAEKASNEKEYKAAKERVGKARDRIHKEAPNAAKDADKWAEKYGADKRAGLDAKVQATGADATAKADDRATDKKNDEMAALLRNRHKPSSPAP